MSHYHGEYVTYTEVLEDLAKELVKTLEYIERQAMLAKVNFDNPDAGRRYATEIQLTAQRNLEKAKEVLGDG